MDFLLAAKNMELNDFFEYFLKLLDHKKLKIDLNWVTLGCRNFVIDLAKKGVKAMKNN